jgi:hypothetical protein
LEIFDSFQTIYKAITFITVLVMALCIFKNKVLFSFGNTKVLKTGLTGAAQREVACDEISQPCFVIKYIDTRLTAFQLKT